VDLTRLDLNLFVVFDAIYREASLTRAGHALHITQPAVSHALARLRELCADPLFIKTGRQMLPTPRARTMAPLVQEALAALGASMAQPQGFEPARATRAFTIGLREVQEPLALRALLPQLGAQAPGVTLALVRMDRDRLEDDLRLGVLDAALDVQLPTSRHIGRLKVMSEPMVVLARAGHPRVQGQLSLEAYLAEAHVLVSTRRSGLGLEDTALGQLGAQRRIVLRCQHYHAACEAVAASDWLLTLPRQHALLSNPTWGHQLLPAPCAMPALEVFLYWDHRLDADPANQWLRRCLLGESAA
jgi:DNA-binding transcriptional LysR family regulator